MPIDRVLLHKLDAYEMNLQDISNSLHDIAKHGIKVNPVPPFNIRLIDAISHRATCADCNKEINKGETCLVHKQDTGDPEDGHGWLYFCRDCSFLGINI